MTTWSTISCCAGRTGRPAASLSLWICRERALHGDGINLRKLVRRPLDYPDPNPPFGAMYMRRPAVEAMIKGLRTDEAYCQVCCNSELPETDLTDPLRPHSDIPG